MALSSFLGPLNTEHGLGFKLGKWKHQAHDVFMANWHLGFTAFGGPPVHFQIVRVHTPDGRMIC